MEGATREESRICGRAALVYGFTAPQVWEAWGILRAGALTEFEVGSVLPEALQLAAVRQGDPVAVARMIVETVAKGEGNEQDKGGQARRRRRRDGGGPADAGAGG